LFQRAALEIVVSGNTAGNKRETDTMAREAQRIPTRSGVHLPKTVSRRGTTQRDWIIGRLRVVRRAVVAVSFVTAALFTGLALHHSLQPASVAPAQSAAPSSQKATSQDQLSGVPSQSLFDNQTSSHFSVAPAPETSSSQVRTVTS
jgi:hypothetical protein